MDLKKLSKKALEAIGRDKGIELDRRLKKDKLVEQLQDALDAEPKSLVELKEEVIEESTAKEEVLNSDVRDKAWWDNFRAKHGLPPKD